MIRRYSSFCLVSYCGIVALGCSEIVPVESDVTSEVSAALFAADPPISAEIELGAATLDRGKSVEAKVAFGAGLYLVVWSIPTIAPSANMYATRITQNGEVLDPSGFYLGSGYPADVTFANGQFVVVSTPLTASPSGDIRATRILPSGEVLDVGGIMVAEQDDTKLTYVYPTVASDGVDFLVAWASDEILPNTYRQMRIARLTAGGEVLDPGGKFITEFIPWTLYPSLAFNGNHYLLAWGPNFSPLQGMRISKSAQPLSFDPFVIDDFVGNHERVKVLYDGVNFAVGSGILDNGNHVFRLRRVSSDGVVDPQPIDVPTGLNSAIFMHMAFNGPNLLVMLDDPMSKSTFSFHVSPDGKMVESEAVLLASNSAAPRVAANGVGAFAVWHDAPVIPGPPSGFAVGARMDSAGTKLDSPPIPMSVRARSQKAPRIAFDGKNYQLAMHDSAGFFAARLTSDATISNGPVLPFPSESPSNSNVTHVMSTGDASGLTWIAAVVSDGATSSTRMVRLSADGKLLDAAPFQLPPSHLGPLVSHQYVASVDPDGALFVGAQDDPQSGTSSRPFAIRFNNQGMVQPQTWIGNDSCVPRSLTFDGSAYLLTCSTPIGDYPSEDFVATLQSARLSPNAELLEAGWKPILTVPNTMFEWFEASFDGKNHWLFWRTDEWEEGYWPDFPRTLRILATRVTPSGEVNDSDPVVVAEMKGCGTAAMRSLHPAVASTGGKTFVVWSEPSNVASCDPMGLDLMGVEIDQEGMVSLPFIVSAEPGTENSPFLATGPEGQVVVTYSRFIPDAPYVADRARARFLQTCVCPDGSACTSGQCVPADVPPNKEPISFGGCGCRTSGKTPTSGAGYASILAATLGWLRRRAIRRRAA
ncbi:MAG: hypothetical protein IPM54_30890 [Polyangiaceae bacterium]|nr:hypothetical protein [Polyangiaceae bacterium]